MTAFPIVVTGATRGIGLELVRQLQARDQAVIALVRNPGRFVEEHAQLAAACKSVHAYEQAEASSIASVAAALGDQPLSGLINNAGVWAARGETLADLDPATLMRLFQINAMGPLLLTNALRPALRAGNARVLHITSGLGSIGDNTSGGYYAYRMSKAALNMASRSLAHDLRGDGICSAVMDPGWVQTDMGGKGAPTSVTDCVRGILQQYDGLTLSASGSCLHWQGQQRPW